MKTSKIKAIDSRLQFAGSLQQTLNAHPDPERFGFREIYATQPDDKAFDTHDNGFAVNDLGTGDKLRAPLQSLIQVAPMNEDLTPVNDFLAPPVDVTSAAKGKFSYLDRSGGINTLTSITSLERAINGDVKVIDGVGEEVDCSVKNYGLGSEIDEDRVLDVQQEMQTRVMEIMELISLHRLNIRLTALTAIANNAAKTWSSGSPNPDIDAINAIESARTGSGIMPSRALYDRGAWVKRLTGFSSQNTAGAFQGSIRDEDGLAKYLGIDQVMVTPALSRDYTGTISSLFGNKVLFFRNNAAATLRSNDILKTFWSADNGVQFRTHQRQVNEKVWRVAVTYREIVLVTGPTTGYPVQQLTIS